MLSVPHSDRRAMDVLTGLFVHREHESLLQSSRTHEIPESGPTRRRRIFAVLLVRQPNSHTSDISRALLRTKSLLATGTRHAQPPWRYGRKPTPEPVWREIMRYSVALLGVVCLFSVVGVSGNAAQQAQPASAKPSGVDDMLAAVRSDLMATRADTMAKNLTMTAEQAAKFWPVYDAYQKEQSAINEDHLKGVERYIEAFDTLDDAGALALLKAHLDRDERMAALRQKALVDFQRVVGTKVAARAIQIDRRLSLVHQLEIVSKIPLIR